MTPTPNQLPSERIKNEELEFTIRITTEEHPSCFGKECEGKHLIKYLVIKTQNQEVYFREGHPVFKALREFTKKQPEVFRNMKRVRAEAVHGLKKYTIEKMLSELEFEISK